jgi:hypothetical protein
MNTNIQRVVYVRPGHPASDTCAEMAANLQSMNVNIAIENIDEMKQKFQERGIPMPSWLTPGKSRIPMLAESEFTQEDPILTAGIAAITRLREIADIAYKATRAAKGRRMMKDGEKFTGGGTEFRSPPPMTGLVPVHPGSVSPLDGASSSPRAQASQRQMSEQPMYSEPQSDAAPPITRECKRRIMGDGEKFTGGG